MSPLMRPFRAALHLLLLAALFYAVGYALCASPLVFQLYRTTFHRGNGHALANRLQVAQGASEELCLLMGPSSVREAFDGAIMHDVVPSLRFLNGGTSGGTIFVYPPMVEMLKQSRVQPEIIVLGLNARMLISRRTRLNAAGYTDFLDLLSDRDILNQEELADGLRDEAAAEMWTNSLWPYNRPARQISRLLRYRLAGLHEQLIWRDPLDSRAFMLQSRELDLAPRFRYPVDADRMPADKLEALRDRYRDQGMFDPERYAQPAHLEALRAVLDDLLERCVQLILVRMPESAFGREHFGALAYAELETVLDEYAARGVTVLDHHEQYPDVALRDVGHLLGRTRPGFSRLVAEEVGAATGRDFIKND